MTYDLDAAVVEKKKSLRAELKRRLNELTYDRQKLAAAFFQNLSSLASFRAAKTIGLYIDFKTEAPTQEMLPLIFAARELSVERVAVPYCVGKDMRFHRLLKPTYDECKNKIFFSDLAPCAPFGILEPTQDYRDDPTFYISPEEIDVLIVPGLGFDLSGKRLGRGAGYYDRYIPLLRQGVHLIGYCYEEQLVDNVPVAEFDVPVSAIVTPNRVIKIRNSVN